MKQYNVILLSCIQTNLLKLEAPQRFDLNLNNEESQRDSLQISHTLSNNPFPLFLFNGRVCVCICVYVCVCVCVRLRGFAWICARPASKLTMTSSVQNLFRFLHDTGQSAAQKKILKAYKAFKSLSSQHVMVSRLFVLQELFTGSLHGLLCPMERVERHNPLRLLPDYDVTWQQNAQHGRWSALHWQY